MFKKQTHSKPVESDRHPASSIKQNKNGEKAKKLTRVIVHCDVGFNNSVFIRGSGANLNWDKGVMLHNTKADEWVWETEHPFNLCEFKVLINDLHYEQGDNRKIECQGCVEYTPLF